MSTSTTTPLFQRPVWVTIFALTAAIAWGWAFPILKIGFTAFGITPDMTEAKCSTQVSGSPLRGLSS